MAQVPVREVLEGAVPDQVGGVVLVAVGVGAVEDGGREERRGGELGGGS